MAFDRSDYERGASQLGASSTNLMAVAAVESSGENFWLIGNKMVPPIRPEAHWFSAKTNHRYDQTHPNISSPEWNPSIAAKTRAEAWSQYEEMNSLDPKAAAESTSWGPFQIMGFHWKDMGYPSVEAFVDAMDGPDDDGQMDTFVAFVKRDPVLLRAIRRGDWESWETRYNGGGYGGAYAQKIRNWLNMRSSGEDADHSPRTLERGMTGPDVAALQAKLSIDADGVFGQETELAVMQYQRSKSLEVDGKVGKFTRASLGLE